MVVPMATKTISMSKFVELAITLQEFRNAPFFSLRDFLRFYVNIGIGFLYLLDFMRISGLYWVCSSEK